MSRGQRLAAWGRPARFVHGTADRIAPIGPIEQLVADAGDAVALHAIDGGDHLLAPYGEVLRQQARALATEVSEARSS